jgi:hypothetical protein
MFHPQELVIEQFVRVLKDAYEQTYSTLERDLGNITAWTGRLALENIANSDSLYHNVDHTIMVTQVGQAILKGKHLCEGGVTPRNWLHFVIALLCHDIGYVKGVCRDDKDGMIATGVDGKMVEVSLEWTDAVVTPYHVDRSKLFVRERFGGRLGFEIDVELIASYIEMTRFPVPDGDDHKDTKGYPGLVRAADFIGQLGDPNYLRKIPALFYELQEAGANERIGYRSPGELRENYTQFYCSAVMPHIQEGLRYLRVTHEGRQWIANLHSHVYSVDH